MRYATFSLPHDSTPRLGIARGDSLINVPALLAGHAGDLPGSLQDLITQGPEEWQRIARLIDQSLVAGAPKAAVHAADSVHWHPPTGRPAKNVVCLGLNYISHAKE